MEDEDLGYDEVFAEEVEAEAELHPPQLRPGSYKQAPAKRTLHPRNKFYSSSPDFAALAKKYPEFDACVNKNEQGHVTVDWKDARAVRILTQTLLREYYDIRIELPEDHLCPTVSTRANYIHWLEDLVAQARRSDVAAEEWDTAPVRGIDIGCGASCIYPLLGVALHPGGAWNFVATEVDTASIAHAQHNIALNGWQPYIRVVHQPDPSHVLRAPGLFAERVRGSDGEVVPSLSTAIGVGGGAGDGGDVATDGATLATRNSQGTGSSYDYYDFCMFNPPFFTQVEDKAERATTSCEATSSELAFSGGGELQLLQEMLQDSIRLRDRVRWYTSMVGRKVSLKKFLAQLRRYDVAVIRQTEFCQGRTTRWFIAWSWGKDPAEKKSTLPPPVQPVSAPNKRYKSSPLVAAASNNNCVASISTPSNCAATTPPPTNNIARVYRYTYAWSKPYAVLLEQLRASVTQASANVRATTASATTALTGSASVDGASFEWELECFLMARSGAGASQYSVTLRWRDPSKSRGAGGGCGGGANNANSQSLQQLAQQLRAFATFAATVRSLLDVRLQQQ